MKFIFEIILTLILELMLFGIAYFLSELIIFILK